MMIKRTIVVMMAVVLCTAMAHAGIKADLSGDAIVDFATTMDLPLMAVGNVGNAGDTEVMNDDGTTGYGAIGYAYNIGKFEVTAGQYTEFLNAVAADDQYLLYRTDMSDISGGGLGCNIQRSGTAGSYTYSVAADWEDRPVNHILWSSAARFANWLTNGMPTGGQDLTTTEDGSYFLNGTVSYAALLAVTRKADARYVIPSENEWYKAAYHKNDGVTGNYFDYPTSSDTAPTNGLIDPDPGNNANVYESGYAIGSPYYRTEVGEFELSESPYDTFDQGGNVWEWNEAVIGSWRGLRGGSFTTTGADYLHASLRSRSNPPSGAYLGSGFRVSEVPEPASAALMLIVGGCLVRRKRRRVA